MKFYLPDASYPCVVFNNATTVRAYNQVPQRNSTISYTDYYYNGHYYYVNGQQTFGQTSQLPSCSSVVLTDNVFYRTDIADIMITFFIILLVCFYFPYRIISRMFGRWFKW